MAELTRLLATLPIDEGEPFADVKGRMNWPAQGKVLKRYGQAKADGRLRWDGMSGWRRRGRTEVRAVHHGRVVVFSDWLPGMGLLVVAGARRRVPEPVRPQPATSIDRGRATGWTPNTVIGARW